MQINGEGINDDWKRQRSTMVLGSNIYSDREQERYKCEFIVGDTEAYDVSIEF